MNKPPFVYLYSDAQAALQILARGKNGVVWLALGILLPTHPEGISKTEIVTETGLTGETVQAALTSLTVGKLIENIGGNYAPSQYIEYRKASKNNLSSPSESSINHQSSVNLSKSKKNTEDEFGTAMRALASALLSYGGMNAAELQDFAELWTDYPDAALHERALQITVERAERPNYRYYAAVVRSGAKPTTYPTKQERVTRAKDAPVLEILL